MAGFADGIQMRAPWYSAFVRYLSSHWDEQQRVSILGMRPSDGDIVVRFLASRATLYVRVHIQHDGTGGGGETYDASVYVSDTRIDCRVNRQQDTTITRSTADDYYVWLIPEFLEGDSTSYTRYDGETGEGVDRMAFVALGANSSKIELMTEELAAMREVLTRILAQAAIFTGCELDAGEK